MKRRSKGGVRHLGDNRWQLYTEAPADPLTGRRRRRTKLVQADSRRDALDELAAFIATKPAPGPAPARTVNALLDAWLEHLDVDPATIFEWTASLHRYVRPHIGDRDVEDIGAETLDRLYAHLARKGGHNGRPLTASTIRKTHAALRLAFAQAVRWRWATYNPTLDVTIPGGRRTKIAAPDPAVVTANMRAIEAKDPDLAGWLRVIAHVGCRREEALGLRWSAVDLDSNTVSIRTVVKLIGGAVTIAELPKTNSSVRTVAISPAIAAQLRAMRARQKATAIAAAGTWSPEGFVLSPDPTARRPYHPRSVARRLEKLEKKLKLPHVTILQLRHHMATRAISRGHDVRTVAGRGGWANADTLLRVYADWVPARDRSVAEDDADVG